LGEFNFVPHMSNVKPILRIPQNEIFLYIKN